MIVKQENDKQADIDILHSLSAQASFTRQRPDDVGPDDAQLSRDYEWRARDRWGIRLLHVAIYATLLGTPWADFYFFDGRIFLLLGSFQPLLMFLAFGAMAFIVYMASIAKEDLRINVTKVPEGLLYAMLSLCALLGCLWLREAITDWIAQHTSQIAMKQPTSLSPNQALFLPYLRMHITLWSLLTGYVTKTYWDHAVKLMDPIAVEISANVPLVRRDRHKSADPKSPRKATLSLLLLPFCTFLAFGSYGLATSTMTWVGALMVAGIFAVTTKIGYSSLKRSGHSRKWAQFMIRSITASFALGALGHFWPISLFVMFTVLTGVLTVFLSVAIIAVSFLPQYSPQMVYQRRPPKP